MQFACLPAESLQFERLTIPFFDHHGLPAGASNLNVVPG